MYIITVRRITSGELLKQRKGLRIAGGYGSSPGGSSQFSLTMPVQGQADSPKMSMTGGTTLSQIVAVTVLTLLALGAGIVLAGLSGGLEMVPTQMESMPVPH